MGKIYSRPRIKIFYSKEKKKRRKIAIILIAIIATITVENSVKSISPMFETMCKDKAIQISTSILNKVASNVLKKYDYKELVSIKQTEENNILTTDVTVINEIASDIAADVTKELQNLAYDRVKIPIGAIFGNKYLSGMGPKVNITIIPSGTVTTEMKTEFKSEGINQTVYRVYLEVICNEEIVMSYKTIDTKVVNQVLLVETVIVGDVPQTYYNLEGVNRNNAIDIIE